jgi:hypothetical protein
VQPQIVAAIPGLCEDRRQGQMFDTELRYFIDHQDELVAEHRGKTLVIVGERVEGVYTTPMEAYIAASGRFAPGTFMIQPCAPGPSAYTVLINTRHA